MTGYYRPREPSLEVNACLLIVAVTGEGKPKLYVFSDRGLTELIHDNSGYALLRSQVAVDGSRGAEGG